MTKIIAIINQKGGVGKTATACNLAYCFAMENQRTLLIDLDPSANATHVFVQDETYLTAKDFLLSKEVMLRAIVPVRFNVNNISNSLFILPSHISLALTEREMGNRPFQETFLKKKLLDPAISENYDYILIDCPPTLSTLTINAMFAADFILIPVNYQKNALEGVADLFEILEEIKEGQVYDFRILRNQYDARKKTANDFVAEKLQSLINEGVVLNTIIRQDESVNRATLENMTTFQQYPKNTAVMDYLTLQTELEELFNG